MRYQPLSRTAPYNLYVVRNPSAENTRVSACTANGHVVAALTSSINWRRLILALTSEEDRNREESMMFALGHKRTYALQKIMSALPPIATAKADFPQTAMSALPPKADMCSALAHVCFGPKADISSFDHLV